MAIKTQFVQPILGGLFGAAGGGSGGGLIGDLISGFGRAKSPNLVTSSAIPQSSGINPVVASSVFGKPMAEGGVATKPTAGIFGEAGAEALIPLDRFKDFQGGSNVTVNVIGAPEGTKTEEKDDGAGGKSVNVILDEMTAQNIRPGTKTFSKLTNTFAGMNTKLTGR